MPKKKANNEILKQQLEIQLNALLESFNSSLKGLQKFNTLPLDNSDGLQDHLLNVVFSQTKDFFETTQQLAKLFSKDKFISHQASIIYYNIENILAIHRKLSVNNLSEESIKEHIDELLAHFMALHSNIMNFAKQCIIGSSSNELSETDKKYVHNFTERYQNIYKEFNTALEIVNQRQINLINNYIKETAFEKNQDKISIPLLNELFKKTETTYRQAKFNQKKDKEKAEIKTTTKKLNNASSDVLDKLGNGNKLDEGDSLEQLLKDINEKVTPKIKARNEHLNSNGNGKPTDMKTSIDPKPVTEEQKPITDPLGASTVNEEEPSLERKEEHPSVQHKRFKHEPAKLFGTDYNNTDSVREKNTPIKGESSIPDFTGTVKGVDMGNVKKQFAAYNQAKPEEALSKEGKEEVKAAIEENPEEKEPELPFGIGEGNDVFDIEDLEGAKVNTDEEYDFAYNSRTRTLIPQIKKPSAPQHGAQQRLEYIDRRLQLYKRISIAAGYLKNATDEDGKKLLRLFQYFIPVLRDNLLRDDGYKAEIFEFDKKLSEDFKSHLAETQPRNQSDQTVIVNTINDNIDNFAKFDLKKLTQEPYIEGLCKENDYDHGQAAQELAAITPKDISDLTRYYKGIQDSARKQELNKDRKDNFKRIVFEFDSLLGAIKKSFENNVTSFEKAKDLHDLYNKDDLLNKLYHLFNDGFLLGFINPSNAGNLLIHYISACNNLLNFLNSTNVLEQFEYLNQAIANFYKLLDINNLEIRGKFGWQFSKNAFATGGLGSKNKENKKVIPTIKGIKGNIETFQNFRPLLLVTYAPKPSDKTPAASWVNSLSVTESVENNQIGNLLKEPVKPTIQVDADYIQRPYPYLLPGETKEQALATIKNPDHALTARDVDAAWQIMLANFNRQGGNFTNLPVIGLANSKLVEILKAEQETRKNNQQAPQLLVFKILKESGEWALLAVMPNAATETEAQFLYIDPSIAGDKTKEPIVPASINAVITSVYPNAKPAALDYPLFQRLDEKSKNNKIQANASGLHVIAIAEKIFQYAAVQQNDNLPINLADGELSILLDNIDNSAEKGKTLRDRIADNIKSKIKLDELRSPPLNPKPITSPISPGSNNTEKKTSATGTSTSSSSSFVPTMENPRPPSKKKPKLKNEDEEETSISKTEEKFGARLDLSKVKDEFEKIKKLFLGTEFYGLGENLRATQALIEQLADHKTELNKQIAELKADNHPEVIAFRKEINNYFSKKEIELGELLAHSVKATIENAKRNNKTEYTSKDDQTIDEGLPPLSETESVSEVDPELSELLALARDKGRLPPSNREAAHPATFLEEEKAVQQAYFSEEKKAALQATIIKAAPKDGALSGAAAHFAKQQQWTEINLARLQNRNSRNKATKILVAGVTTASVGALLATTIAVGVGSAAFPPAAVASILITAGIIGYAWYVDRADKKLAEAVENAIDEIINYFIPYTDKNGKTHDPDARIRSGLVGSPFTTRREIGEAILYQLLTDDDRTSSSDRLLVVQIVRKLFIKSLNKQYDQDDLGYRMQKLASGAFANLKSDRLTEVLDLVVENSFSALITNLETQQDVEEVTEENKKLELVAWLNTIYTHGDALEPKEEAKIEELYKVLVAMKKENLIKLVDMVGDHEELNPVIKLLLKGIRPVTIQDILAKRREEFQNIRTAKQSDKEYKIVKDQDFSASFALIQKYNQQHLDVELNYARNFAGISSDLNFALDQLNEKNIFNKNSKNLYQTAEATLTVVKDILENLAKEDKQEEADENSLNWLEIVIKEISPTNLGKLFTGIITGIAPIDANITTLILNYLQKDPSILQKSFANARNELGSSRRFITAVRENLFSKFLDTNDFRNGEAIIAKVNGLLASLLEGFKKQHLPLIKSEAEASIIGILTAHDEFYRSLAGMLAEPGNEGIFGKYEPAQLGKEITACYDMTANYIQSIPNLEQKRHFEKYYHQTPYYVLTRKGTALAEGSIQPKAKEIRKAFESIITTEPPETLNPEEKVNTNPEKILDREEKVNTKQIIQGLFKQFSHDPQQQQEHFVVYMQSFAATEINDYNLEMRKNLIINYFELKPADVELSADCIAANVQWFVDMESNEAANKLEKPRLNTYLDVFTRIGPENSLELLAEVENAKPGLAGKIVYEFFHLGEKEDTSASEKKAIDDLLLNVQAKETDSKFVKDAKEIVLASVIGEIYKQAKAKKEKAITIQFNDFLKKFLNKVGPDEDIETRITLLTQCVKAVAKHEKMPSKDAQTIVYLLFESTASLFSEYLEHEQYINSYIFYLNCYDEVGLSKSALKNINIGFEQTKLGQLFSFNSENINYKKIAQTLTENLGPLTNQEFGNWVRDALIKTNELTINGPGKASKYFMPKLIVSLLHSNIGNKDHKITYALVSYIQECLMPISAKTSPKNFDDFKASWLTEINKHISKEQREDLNKLIFKNFDLTRYLLNKETLVTTLKEAFTFINMPNFIKAPSKTFGFWNSSAEKSRLNDPLQREHDGLQTMRNDNELMRKLSYCVRALYHLEPEDGSRFTKKLDDTNLQIIDKSFLENIQPLIANKPPYNGQYNTKLLIQAVWTHPPLKSFEEENKEIIREDLDESKNIFQAILTAFFENLLSTYSHQINSLKLNKAITEEELKAIRSGFMTEASSIFVFVGTVLADGKRDDMKLASFKQVHGALGKKYLASLEKLSSGLDAKVAPANEKTPLLSRRGKEEKSSSSDEENKPLIDNDSLLQLGADREGLLPGSTTYVSPEAIPAPLIDLSGSATSSDDEEQEEQPEDDFGGLFMRK